jgi:hypothetical protein
VWQNVGLAADNVNSEFSVETKLVALLPVRQAVQAHVTTYLLASRTLECWVISISPSTLFLIWTIPSPPHPYLLQLSEDVNHHLWGPHLSELLLSVGMHVELHPH